MEELLANPYFRFAALPLGGLLAAIFLRHTSRNDRYRRFGMEDFAVGLDLALAATLLVVSVVAERAIDVVGDPEPAELSTLRDDLNRAFGILLLFVIALWGVSTHVRMFGWQTQPEASEREELRLWRGIVLPLVVGAGFVLIAIGEVTR